MLENIWSSFTKKIRLDENEIFEQHEWNMSNGRTA